jgi:hypothetical protein
LSGQQVYNWGGTLKIVTFTLPPMKKSDAILWDTFFKDLKGQSNTFVVDLSAIFPGHLDMTAVSMRLTKNENNFEVGLAEIYSFSFTAMEAK